MIAAYIEHFQCARPVAINSLLAMENGEGQMDSRFIDLDVSTGSALFVPIREAFYKAKAQPVPPLSLTEENATGAELEQHARDKAAAEAAQKELDEAQATAPVVSAPLDETQPVSQEEGTSQAGDVPSAPGETQPQQ